MKKDFCAAYKAKRKDIMKCLKNHSKVKKTRYDGQCPVEGFHIGVIDVEDEETINELMKTGLFLSFHDYQR